MLIGGSTLYKDRDVADTMTAKVAEGELVKLRFMKGKLTKASDAGKSRLASIGSKYYLHDEAIVLYTKIVGKLHGAFILFSHANVMTLHMLRWLSFNKGKSAMIVSLTGLVSHITMDGKQELWSIDQETTGKAKPPQALDWSGVGRPSKSLDRGNFPHGFMVLHKGGNHFTLMKDSSQGIGIPK